MRLIVGGLLRLWRSTLGLVLPDSCRFTPTCSHYAAEAVLRRGLIIGLALALWRVLRCQPLHPGGYDPVISSRPPCLPPRPIRGSG